jgi:6-phosphofructokinase 2
VPAGRIVTLTLNPTIDISSEAEKVRHTHKTRTFGEEIEPGGGGINVARVLRQLGADVCALFLSGGITGKVLDDLLKRAGIDHRMAPIHGDTRISLTIAERSTGKEYRFVPEGPEVSRAEAQALLDMATQIECDYLVASGSLPRGVDADFYAELAGRTSGRGVRFVLDTSGPPLRAAIAAGGIFLLKPSRGEFEAFAGHALFPAQLAEEAEELVESGKVEQVAITLGKEGAILANRDGSQIRPAIAVEACSAVGAGDSFLAGMVYGFTLGKNADDAFRMGLAAGAAAVLSCGSELCKPEDLKRLIGEAMSGEQVDDLGIGKR